MRSPEERRDSDNAHGTKPTVQDTLDAYEPEDLGPEGVGNDGNEVSSVASHPTYHVSIGSRQESIDVFGPDEDGTRRDTPSTSGNRALEGLALEMRMERVALTEAASGISRDELLITIAREVEVPLERLDLVDGYLTDLELEGKVRRVGDSIVLVRPDDGDLVAMDLSESDYLGWYRRRYLMSGGGEGR